MPQPFIFSTETIKPGIDINPDAFEACLAIGDTAYPGDAGLAEHFAGTLSEHLRAYAHRESPAFPLPPGKEDVLGYLTELTTAQVDRDEALDLTPVTPGEAA
jgi:hypothetical protein